MYRSRVCCVVLRENENPSDAPKIFPHGRRAPASDTEDNTHILYSARALVFFKDRVHGTYHTRFSTARATGGRAAKAPPPDQLVGVADSTTSTHRTVDTSGQVCCPEEVSQHGLVVQGTRGSLSSHRAAHRMRGCAQDGGDPGRGRGWELTRRCTKGRRSSRRRAGGTAQPGGSPRRRAWQRGRASAPPRGRI